MADLTISGGTVMDGSGRPGYQADVVVDGGSIVLVGDASTFLDDLPRVGFDRVEVVPQAELDLLAPDFRRRGRAAP